LKTRGFTNEETAMFKPEFKDLILDGKIYDLGQPLYPGIPHHPLHPPFAYVLARKHGEVRFEGGASSANDLFAFGGHTGTHLDAVGHISMNGRIFGDIEAESCQDFAMGLMKKGIDETPPIITRGILLDVPRIKACDVLNSGYPIGENDIKETLAFQGNRIQPGDTVLVRTGWAKYWESPDRFNDHGGVPGITLDAAEFLAGSEISYVGADTTACEVVPSSSMEVHGFLLAERGIQIMEMLNLEQLARERIYEFLFIACPLKIRGGTGSPIRPIAIR
jgi:kynurenine formamidase